MADLNETDGGNPIDHCETPPAGPPLLLGRSRSQPRAQGQPSPRTNAASNPSAIQEVWTQVKSGVKELLHAASEGLGLRAYVDPAYSETASGPVLLLGRRYSSLQDPLCRSDLQSRLWITYRHSFPPIANSAYTSDVGWGCMLRSGQMLLSNAFLLHFLGRDWTLEENKGEKWDEYVKIISWFLDSNSSPYSIHRIALIGVQFDKNIGEWFGPTTISQVLRILHESHQRETKFSIHVVSDGNLLLDELTATRTEDDGSNAVLILVPVRLGLDSLNPVYYPAIKHFFTMPSCVGIAGGRPNSSLYFTGVEGENHLTYMDPHLMRQTIDLKDPASYTPEDLETYHCPSIRVVPISTLDPSMVFGFYCRNEKEVTQFLEDAKKNLCSGSTPLFCIQDTAPNYQDADVLSDAESDF
ncbi:hypothetical protein BJ741DRAFT_599736 [Chytriomyces cf. hyalinus JEL632]|nr:hypothetical protein BJ741DRAFT_599736 [Chytriomyces cf. hyalinus JEL632]